MTTDIQNLQQATRGRIIVAMSGGVDSSVVAARLHRDGYDVVGISMRLYSTPHEEPGKSCCSPDDLLDARTVASAAGFPFYVANYQEEFQERIVNYFVSEYRRGRTPSPCVLCNDHLKFDTLLDRMQALGGDKLATGHYARIEEREGRYALLRGVDRKKDQSYFLFGLRRDVLKDIIFPLGNHHKPEVRVMAEELGVPTAKKPESQDICFVSNGNYATFVEERLADDEIVSGEIKLRSTGEVLGTHDGIHQFTIGQRRGLGVSYTEPVYVQSIDPEEGTILVDVRDELGATSFHMDRCNWLRWEQPPETFECLVQVRYRHRPVAATVEVSADDPTVATVKLPVKEQAITPGQATVCYDGDEVLGGGWVYKVD